MNTVTASELRRMILDDCELALLDAREERRFAESHIFYASCCALSRLERLAPLLVPRHSARVVTCDAGGGEAARAAARLRALGYTDVSVLEGGVSAWTAAGYTLFSGVNVPSKAFGEVVEHEHGTPSISAEELRAMLDAGEDPVILDSRPTPEFTNFSIPGGICCPGAELAWRVHDAAPSPDTTVVVNCAGRTRSIIGAQAVINAGVPNRVASLRNGTMAWHLAGFELAKGATKHAAKPSAEGLARARAAAARVAGRFAVRSIDHATLDRWRAERGTRSLFVFDVRTREEYEAGHLPDARWVAGGQLVQATDRHIGTLRSRVVLVDDDGVRATMTASWLVQMGWREAVVLAWNRAVPRPSATLNGAPAVPRSGIARRPRRRSPLEGGIEGHGLETGMPVPPILGSNHARPAGIAPDALAAALDRDEAVVVDVSLSRAYRAGHVPGARHAIRARLDRSLDGWPAGRMLVVTSDDEALAALAAAEAATLVDAPVRALEGGNAGWVAAGHSLTAAEPRFLDEPDDVPVRVHEAEGGMEKAMHEYLEWEIGLVAEVVRDGTAAWLHGGHEGERGEEGATGARGGGGITLPAAGPRATS